jgi:hypothetical protein
MPWVVPLPGVHSERTNAYHRPVIRPLFEKLCSPYGDSLCNFHGKWRTNKNAGQAKETGEACLADQTPY